MRRSRLFLACLLAPLSLSAVAADFSGTYDCRGHDHSEGPYNGIVTLKRIAEHSHHGHTAYRFQLDVPGYGSYPGQAVALGRQLAVHFANTDTSTADYGTGLATFKKNAAGRWTFSKFYYEPEYKGGNHGVETCVQRPQAPAGNDGCPPDTACPASPPVGRGGFSSG